MTPPRNIVQFNQVVAVTLVKLYAAFPNPIDLRGRDIGAEAATDFEDDAEQFQLMTETAGNTIGFLVQEGFIRYDPTAGHIGGPEYPSATLTLKGFTLLGTTPEAVDEAVERRPFINQLQDVVQEGARASATQVVGSLFTGALRLGAAAMGAV